MLPRFNLPLPPADFLRDYWQKKPLVMKAVASGLDHPDPDTLAGLALEDFIESRLIIGADQGPWDMKNGPLTEKDFSTLPDKNWTLLVQSVDHFLTETSLLLDDFNFLPNWRQEDIMMSYAVKGGSVGPHYDRYDVFLVQARGSRRWMIGGTCDESTPLLPNEHLRLLADMPVQEEHLMGPGDVLYLPPGISHWGIAEDDDCVTWSVGFRAPSPADLLARMADLAIERADRTLYQDPARTLTETPELLTDADVSDLAQQGLNIISADIRREALATLLSEPRAPQGLDFTIDTGHIAHAAPGTWLVRHGATRLLLDSQGNAWINGEPYPLSADQRPLVTFLARQRRYTESELGPFLNDDSQALLESWIDAGYFSLIE